MAPKPVIVTCAVCGTRRPPWHWVEILPGGTAGPASDGWEKIGSRYYCRACVGTLAGAGR